MFQIQDVKFNGSTTSLSHFYDEEPADSVKNFNKITTSASLPSINVRSGESSYQNLIEKSKNCQRKISLTDGLLVENISENLCQSHNNFGVTPSKDLNDLEWKNLARSVVKTHFVNTSYDSSSDATDLDWRNSVTSMESNEHDRRFYETKQWHSNLFFYKRTDTVINLNRRVQLKFKQLKPLNIWKHLKVSL